MEFSVGNIVYKPWINHRRISDVAISNFTGRKCYTCFYWNGPEVPENILVFNDASCGKGNTSEKRFQQECNQGETCAQAHVEFIKEATEVKSITSRSCVKPDKVINEKCVSLKTLKDLNSLKETSRIVIYDRDGVVKNGVTCGCTGD